MLRSWCLPLLGLALAASSLTACGDDDGGGSEGDGDGELTVLAAASLTGTFEQLGEQFDADHDGVEVTFSFDSSGTLSTQAVEGAPGDVLATADESSMQDAVDGAAVDGDPTIFATNVITLVVPSGNPAGIESIEDLDEDGVTYAVCVDTAPCGKSAAALLESLDLGNEPATEEVDVKATLQKVTSGQVDAGLVYVTDAIAAGDEVEQIDIPEADTQPQNYPIALLQQSEDADLAQEFVDLVLSEEGQQVLADAGFGGAP